MPSERKVYPANRPKNLIRRVDRARNFPFNTCPASRHVQMIGESLIRGKPYPMIEEEPEHVGSSLLATVEALFKARTEIDRLRTNLGLPLLYSAHPLPESEGKDG